MLKKKYIVLLTVLLIVLPILFASEFLLKEPNIEVRGVDIRDISLTATTIDIKTVVQNPNIIGANLDKIAYNIYFLSGEDDWQFLASGVKEDISIKANGNTTVIIPLKISNIQAIMATFQRFFEGPTTLKVNGTTSFDLWIFSYDMPFESVTTQETGEDGGGY